MSTPKVIYIGFNRPMSALIHGLVESIAQALKKKEITVTYPKSSACLINSAPKDGLWPITTFASSEAALFVIDQNGWQDDAMVQLGFVLAAKLPVSCIFVRHSVCSSTIIDLANAYGLPIHEIRGTSLPGELVEECLRNQRVLV